MSFFLIEIAPTSLLVAPSDDVINILTEKKLIGDCVVHLEVELGVSIGDIKETMHNFPKELYGQKNDLLIKWQKLGKIRQNKTNNFSINENFETYKISSRLSFCKESIWRRIIFQNEVKLRLLNSFHIMLLVLCFRRIGDFHRFLIEISKKMICFIIGPQLTNNLNVTEIY